MAKPKVAFYWCASCGGCEEAIIDLHEDILKVAELVDIVFWPCAMDFKTEDVKNMQDNEIAVCFINGAIRTSEQEEMAKLLRKKSQLIVSFGACSQLGGIPGLANFWDRDVKNMLDNEIAVCFINGAIRTSEQEEMAKLLRKKSQLIVSFGACSQLGGIPGLANFWDRETIFASSYGGKCPSVDNPDGVVPQEVSEVPEGELYLPRFYNTVKTTDQVIDVDYYLPGCSPAPYLTMQAITTILSGDLPPKGTVLAPNKALCEVCSRNDSKPEKLSIDKINRVSLVEVDPEKCFLAQGIICMGPVTRSGCNGENDGRCIAANMPCRGCYGPPSEVHDVGAKMIAALASVVGLEGEEDMSEADVQKLLDQIVDPAGLFYRFSLAKSYFRRKIMTDSKEEK